jgi:hypothetical protein
MRPGLKWLAMKTGAGMASCLIFVEQKTIPLLMLLQRIKRPMGQSTLPQSARQGGVTLLENCSKWPGKLTVLAKQQISMTVCY